MNIFFITTIKIIDFDELDFLDYSYDLIFIIATCINIGEWNTKNFNRKLRKTFFFLKIYKNKELINYLKDNVNYFVLHTKRKYKKRKIKDTNMKKNDLNQLNLFLIIFNL